MNGLVPQLRDEPPLTDLRTRAAGLLRQADRGRAGQDAEGRDRRRYQRFLQLRKEALFHETQFTGLDLPRNVEVTRRSARDALAIFAAPGSRDLGTLAALPATFSDRERTEIAEGCYELLLILAEATDQADQGLRLLDQAVRLHPAPTRAYHLRRAVCLARRGDTAGAGRAPRRGRAHPAVFGARSVPDRAGAVQARRLDHGPPALRRRLAVATRPLLGALPGGDLLPPDEPAREAVYELNACLQREPDFAWLYVLRGYASSQAAARNRDEAAKLLPAQAAALRADETLQFQAAEADFRSALDAPGAPAGG